MDRNTYLDIVKGIQPGAFFRLAWEKDEAPAAAHRKAGVVLTKRVRAVVRAGIDFANMKVNEGRETGPLPWGEWDDESNHTLIFTRDEDTNDPSKFYARVYINRVTEAEYFVNGQQVARDEYVQYLIPSKREKPASVGNIANITLDHVTEAGVSRAA